MANTENTQYLIDSFRYTKLIDFMQSSQNDTTCKLFSGNENIARIKNRPNGSRYLKHLSCKFHDLYSDDCCSCFGKPKRKPACVHKTNAHTLQSHIRDLSFSYT